MCSFCILSRWLKLTQQISLIAIYEIGFVTTVNSGAVESHKRLKLSKNRVYLLIRSCRFHTLFHIFKYTAYWNNKKSSSFLNVFTLFTHTRTQTHTYTFAFALARTYKTHTQHTKENPKPIDVSRVCFVLHH